MISYNTTSIPMRGLSEITGLWKIQYSKIWSAKTCRKYAEKAIRLKEVKNSLAQILYRDPVQAEVLEDK